ncbi:S8 family serine peptidase [bacterium]|nr:S8 family serine peptidase [bacterium]
MKKVHAFVVLAALLIAASTCLSGQHSGNPWLPGRLLVNFKSEVGEIHTQRSETGALQIGVPAVDELLLRYEVTAMIRIVPDGVIAKHPCPPDVARLVELLFPDQYDVVEVRRSFLSCSHVADATPDELWYADDTIPNDPQWGQQWDKRLMNCPRAWDFSQGSRDVIAVAVDNGTWWEHPEFYNNLWVNPDEDTDGDGVPYIMDFPPYYPGDYDDLNGVDDGNNGYVDDFIGWDFIDNISGADPCEDADVMDNDPAGCDNHGTHVLGIIGAEGNNAQGVAGVNWHLQVMGSRSGYLPAGGEGVVVTSAAIACINWAVAQGVNVINMSYGGPGFNNQVNNTLQAAWNAGALLVAAAGNDGSTSIQYPAGYQNVIAVGSVDSDDGVSSFSNRGTWVDCYAPGNPIQSLSVSNGYASLSGTSMASPNCAGVGALLWSIFPTLTNAEIRDLLLQNCSDITDDNPTIDPTYLGFGRADLMLALQSVVPYLSADRVLITSDNDNDGRIESGETGTVSLTVSNGTDWSQATNVSVAISTTDTNLTITNGSFTIAALSPGSSTTLTNPNAQIVCNSPFPYAYTAPIRVEFTMPNGAALVKEVGLRVGRAHTLVVDDDNGMSFSNYFGLGLADNGYNYDDYSTALDGMITWQAIQEYDYIIWACGNEQSNTLTLDDRAALTSFLNAGKNLLLAGQGIDEDADVRGSAFYSDYLHTASGSASGSTQVTSVAGDPISDGTNLILIGGGCGGNGNVSPSVLQTANGGTVFYTYGSTGNGGAVRWSGSYKVAYFGFAIEAACGMVNSTHYRVVIDRVMEWFGAESGIETHSHATPSDFVLHPVYPNPFNPDATVRFELPREANVRISLFDVLGRQVQLIADRRVSAGEHTARVDGSELSSGTYWLNVTANSQSRTQRIILLK